MNLCGAERSGAATQIHNTLGGMPEPSEYEDGHHEVERGTQRRKPDSHPRRHDPGFVEAVSAPVYGIPDRQPNGRGCHPQERTSEYRRGHGEFGRPGTPALRLR